MFRKEFRETIKKTLLYLSFLLLVPLFYIIDNTFIHTGLDYFRAFTLIFGIAIFLLAWLFGGFYKTEYEDHAWEYLLSLPLSKKKIYWVKMLSRLTVFAILLSLYDVCFYLTLSDLPFEKIYMFHPFTLPIFVVSILTLQSFFLGWGKYTKELTIAIFSFWAIYFLTDPIFKKLTSFFSHSTTAVKEEIHFSFVLVFFTFLYSYPFIKVFSRFDLKPNAVHARRFLKYASIPLTAFILLCILIISVF